MCIHNSLGKSSGHVDFVEQSSSDFTAHRYHRGVRFKWKSSLYRSGVGSESCMSDSVLGSCAALGRAFCVQTPG